jgi:hypothetical protein
MEQHKEHFALWTLLGFWGSSELIGLSGPETERVAELYRQARRLQHEHSALPSLFFAPVESSMRTMKMNGYKGILCSEIQWIFALRKNIADWPAGASGNNNSRV